MSGMEKKRKIITIDDIAQTLSIHRRTVMRLIKNGGLPAFRVGGQWRIWEHEFDQYIDSMSTKNAQN